jgi:hypothetical protein
MAGGDSLVGHRRDRSRDSRIYDTGAVTGKTAIEVESGIRAN